MAYLHTERKNQLTQLAAQFLSTNAMPPWGYTEEQITSAIASAKNLLLYIDKTIK